MQNDVAGVDIHEWQARAHDSDRHDGLLDRSVAARLCDGILTLFQEAIRQISRQDQVPKPVRTRLERSYGFIALWSNGYGIRDGNLDDVFAKSRTIRRSTLRILSNITNALLNRLIPLTKISSDALDTLAVKLAAASAEASYIIHDADDGSSSDASSDVFSDPGLDSVSEIAEDLKTDAQCLMELDPLFKAPILSNHSQQKQAAILEWGPEKAYCDKVQQRFPEAEASLVTRLGEANWERYLRCQKMRDQREIELESEADAAPEIPGSGRQAVALAPDYGTIAASSKFHDSGLGTSLPASSSYAETVMTYSGAEGQKIHVPRLSEEAKQGKPFPCVACGGRLVRITNNSAWKRHLYMDLQPYHCLEAGCAKFSFHNRNSWVSHLALEHHYEPDWKPITCPLCLETTEKGKLAVTTHLARHLEEISLSALPACPDEEESDTSSESVADDGASVVSDAAGASQPAMKSVTFYPKDVGQYLDGDVPPPFHINIYRDIHDSVEDFRDTNMPDIFRFAHPRIYDKDKNCHSDHRDISTLVRHLSRPAHRLHVTERFVSSFDVNDQAYPHPRLGLCRLCWRAFPERDTFDDHISHACARVSKGRREKWRILLETFTPLNQHSGVSEESDHASTITRRLIDHFSKHSAQAKIAWDSSNTVWFEDDNHNRFTPNYENFRDNMKVHVWTTPEDDEEPNLVETPAQFGSLAAWLNHLAPEARDKVAALPRKEQEKLMAEWKDTVYRRNPFDNGVKKVILELLDSERIGRAYCTNITIVETPDDIRDRVYGYFLRKGYLNPDTGAYPSRLAFELGPGINLSYENFMHDSTVLVRVMDESEYLSRQLQEQEDRIKRYREANSNKRASTPSPAPPSRPSVDPLPRSWPRDKKSMESHMDESEKKGDSYYREIRYMRCICEHDNFLTDTIFNWPAEEWEAIDVNEAARFLIQCDQCGAWQHGVCMGLRPSDGIPSGYLCEECRPELHEQHYEGKFG
ncbi:hypothetical protein B0H66DRAFT_555696 [Apodospora peruviana]|uniref:Zinc finger PHD-type domain-containing protein n=1 Tax=Apodospora peruviana TaxID=516989 RepID=A0AAE0IDD4_9PEZI|nr:hypothetical protein B0H66DRAFT_555696 [Apodospora peruviana]